MDIQAHIPSALIAIHNFILEHDQADLDRWILNEQAEDPLPGQRRQQEIDFGSLATSEKISQAEKRRAENARDRLANEMWENYLSVLEEYHKQGGVDAMDVDEDEMEIAPLD
ncbi:hypothetical protein EV359DRAFT_85736 [Lentinula novae-zelandiae]|nr:hypothetical protein EV359DRAFT_85736 [Lentinula novae-zelandiae]